MLYEKFKTENDENFRRLTGIKKATFEKMIEILEEADKTKKAKGGRKNKLSIHDQLFITLEYWREYRTYFHIGKSCGISESSTYKTVRWVENTLMVHPLFNLPGKSALLEYNSSQDIMLIDATETPIERPKKNNGCTTLVKRKNILLKHN